MAEFPTLKEIVDQCVRDAVKTITFTVGDRDMTLDELSKIICRYNAMPVVRCGLCKHRFLDGENVVTARCELNHNSLMPDDWYCADGEAKPNAYQEARKDI